MFIVILLWVSLDTVILVLLGMLPTIVALIIDRSKHKSSTLCVGGMNFSGVFPYLLELWTGANTSAIAIITDIYKLLVMFAAAGFGWMLFLAIPPVVGAFLTVMSQRRVAQLRSNQKNIIEEWGEGVAGNLTDGEGDGEALAGEGLLPG